MPVALSAPKRIPTVSVFSGFTPDWQWYAKDCRGKAQWIFHTETPQTLLERMVRRPKLSRIFGAFRCAFTAKRRSVSAVASLSQFNTMWAGFALRLLRVQTPLLSFSFHFPKLPTGIRLVVAKWAFSRVERFTVHSEAERRRYSQHFGIAEERFDLVRWGVDSSTVDIEDAPPPLPIRYICALGKDGRDYDTLMKAMKQLPELTLIVVAQPYNLTGVDIPENVKISFNIPREEAINILRHSHLMVLPLESDEASCGHITLVSAMFCRKAIIATNSSGIADYFPADYDAPKIAAGDANGWAEAIRVMMEDEARLERCANAGEEFSHRYCSHDAAYRGNMETFRKAGIVIE